MKTITTTKQSKITMENFGTISVVNGHVILTAIYLNPAADPDITSYKVPDCPIKTGNDREAELKYRHDRIEYLKKLYGPVKEFFIPEGDIDIDMEIYLVRDGEEVMNHDYLSGLLGTIINIR